MATQKDKKLNTIARALGTSLAQKHLLGSWTEVDPEGRMLVSHWACCLKCGDSIFTYRDGSYLGLENQCSLEVRFQEGGADSSIEQHRRVSSKTVTFTIQDRQ